ncbi:Protein misato 1 [Podochytrium sp. JEL0797]|nr:Protein misato 1 [Podochytrium sp. JEL0797]
MDEDEPEKKQQIPEQPVAPKKFSKALDSKVHVWSDFNSMFYHPRTVCELPSNYSHGDTQAPFAVFNQGTDLWAEDHALQDDILENRIRFFLEECDNPQGIQVLADVSNAFSGFTASCLESLREDVGKMCITVFGISDDCDGIPEPVRKMNESLAMSHISDLASLYVPVGKPADGRLYRGSDFGGFGVKSLLQSRYHWTACLAAAIDTITLPMRLAKSPVTMAGYISPLTQTGPLGMLASSTPFPCYNVQPVKELFSKQLKMGDHVNWVHDATFDLGYDVVEDCSGQVSVLRGVEGANTSNTTTAFNDYLAKSPTPVGCNNSYTSESGFPISLAFPDLFTAETPVDQIPTFARLRASSRLSKLVESHMESLKHVPGKVLRMVGENGIGREVIEGCVDNLSALKDLYDQN